MGLSGILRALFGRKKEDQPHDTVSREDVAYACYSAISEACEECMKLDGLHVLLTHEAYEQTKIPNPNCTHERGCACCWIYTLKTETGCNEVVEFLKENGGIATREAVDKFCAATEPKPHVEQIGERMVKQVDFMLENTEELKTTKGKINRLKKYHENLIKMPPEELKDELVQSSIAKVEARIQELETLQ